MTTLTPRPEPHEVTPWRERERLGERIRSLMEPTFPAFGRLAAWAELTESWPAVELVEEDGEYLLSAEIPGIKKEDLDVSVEDGVLTLRGEKKSARDETKGKVHIRERTFGSFERSFTLPSSVASDKIKADIKDGVIHVHMPKQKGTNGRKVPIQ